MEESAITDCVPLVREGEAALMAQVVLRTTHMPAVLLEAGSIINRKEELELAKPQRVAQRIKAEAA